MAVVSTYPNYQSLRSRWVPRVPEHWSLLRAKNFLREIDDRSKTGEETLLSMRMQRGLVPHNDVSVKRIAPENLIGYKKAQPDELVLNRMQAGNAMFFRNRQPGLVSPDYAVFRLLRNDNPEYLGHLFRSWPMRGLFRSESKGLGTGTSGFLRLYSDRFAALEIPLPPRPEQDQIVAYLRAQDAHIARFIKTKRDLINLLTEQKLRIIDHAIMRGLDSSVALKASGIEWLGEVPEHWQVKRLKWVCRFTYGDSLSDANRRQGDVPVYGSNGQVGVHDEANTVGPCIVIGRKGSFGKVNYSERDLFAIDTTYFIDRRCTKADVRWLYYLLVWCRLDRISKDSAVPGLDRTDALNTLVPVPDLAEQSQIAKQLDTDTAEVNGAIAKVEEEIKLIREYRDRLIADVVTGQVDVRGWQPGPEDVVDDALLSALGDENEDVTEEEDGDGED